MSSGRGTVYRVELTERALLDLEALYAEIDVDNSEAAYVWYNGLEDAIFRLNASPERGARTPEDRVLRQLLYGNKPHVYRVIYIIDKPVRRVTVLHIRHGARDSFRPATLAREES